MDNAFNPSVDVSGYVSLDRRVKGACRCSVCSQNLDISKWYKNDKRVGVSSSDGVLDADVVKPVVVRRKKHDYGAGVVCGFLESERDFDKALDLVVHFLEGYEVWRFRHKFFISIFEILVLHSYHKRFWGC